MKEMFARFLKQTGRAPSLSLCSVDQAPQLAAEFSAWRAKFTQAGTKDDRVTKHQVRRWILAAAA